MSKRQIAGIALIVAGTLSLLVGPIWYGRDTETTSIGPVDISVTEDRTFTVPMWAGLAAMVAGVGLLVVARKDAKA